MLAENTGGRYNPSTDSWTATSTINAASIRVRHTAVWTGSEMIVWGGSNGSGPFLNTANDPWARLLQPFTWSFAKEGCPLEI